jgi:hypothetical protein
MLYGAVMRFFPWNLVLAGMAYVYANHRGRSGSFWAVLSLFLPFLGPLILAFVPPKEDAASEELRRETSALPAVDSDIPIPGQNLLPLLEQCLSGLPEETRQEHRSRFVRVVPNMEFTVWLEQTNMSRVFGEATSNNFTVWLDEGETVRRLYGAGAIRGDRMEAIFEWLQESGAPGHELTIMLREPDGSPRTIRYNKPQTDAAEA